MLRDLSGKQSTIDLQLKIFTPGQPLPPSLSVEAIALFLHENMQPYQDALDDIQQGLNDALSPRDGRGGFVVLAEVNERPAPVLGREKHRQGRVLRWLDAPDRVHDHAEQTSGFAHQVSFLDMRLGSQFPTNLRSYYTLSYRPGQGAD